MTYDSDKPHCLLRSVSTVFLLLIPAASATAQDRENRSAKPAKPNVVLIVMDNLGWGEIGCYSGGKETGAQNLTWGCLP